jgi:hypothetical protein
LPARAGLLAGHTWTGRPRSDDRIEREDRMIEKVITGGQSGAEQEAWAAARRAGVVTGGYMPRGFATEDGPRPRLGALYGAIEFPLNEPTRFRANLRRADALLWLGDVLAEDGRAAIEACRELGKPFLTAEPGATPVSDVVSWLIVFEVRSLTIAASPPSRAPDLGPRVGRFLDLVLAGLRDEPSRPRR